MFVCWHGNAHRQQGSIRLGTSGSGRNQDVESGGAAAFLLALVIGHENERVQPAPIV